MTPLTERAMLAVTGLSTRHHDARVSYLPDHNAPDILLCRGVALDLDRLDTLCAELNVPTWRVSATLLRMRTTDGTP